MNLRICQEFIAQPINEMAKVQVTNYKKNYIKIFIFKSCIKKQKKKKEAKIFFFSMTLEMFLNIWDFN